MPEEPAKLDEPAEAKPPGEGRTLGAPVHKPPEKSGQGRLRRRLLWAGVVLLALAAAVTATYLILRPHPWKDQRGTIVPGVPDPVVRYVVDLDALSRGCLEGEYPGVARMADSPEVARAFRSWLATDGPWKGANWVVTWGALRHRYAVDDPLLIRTFLKHQDRHVSWQACELLAERAVRDPSGQDEFFRLLQDMLGDKSLKPMVFSLINDWAVLADHSRGDVRAAWAKDRACYVNFLLPLLNDPEADTRQAAARLLGWLGDRRAVDPLTALLKKEDLEPDVRAAAAEALKKIRGDSDGK